MKKITGVLCALILLIALTLFIESGTEATPDILNSFSARYGATLAERFSCELCHPPGVFSTLNSYGEDLANAIVETGNCLEFYPPNTHTIPHGHCGYLHPEGHDTPFSAGCTRCHGVTLEGLIAPSCYLCHGKLWDEDGPAPTGDTTTQRFVDLDQAFAYIENYDSDGDGFSNIVEINANSHPGNANITPGSSTVIDATFLRSWRRSWYDETVELQITIKPGQYTEIDLEQPIYLEAGSGRLFLTQITEMDGNIKIDVPKALLLTLFKDFTTDKGGDITVVCRNVYGERVADTATAKLLGNVNATVVGSSRAQTAPTTWDASSDVEIWVKDQNQLIDEKAKITVIGPGGDTVLQNVVREGTRVTGTLKANDALAVIGPGMENTNYTIVVTGSGMANKSVFFATARVQAVPGGGGGDNCLDFNPPGSHNVSHFDGECEYLHAPGADVPFDSGCNACHGSDLRGSSFAPSCYTCHDAIWQSVPRTAPRAGK